MRTARAKGLPNRRRCGVTGCAMALITGGTIIGPAILDYSAGRGRSIIETQVFLVCPASDGWCFNLIPSAR